MRAMIGETVRIAQGHHMRMDLRRCHRPLLGALSARAEVNLVKIHCVIIPNHALDLNLY
jgi:hypothetical protein